MKKTLVGVMFAFVMATMVNVSPVHAQTTDVSSLLDLLRSLMAQVEELQKQLTEVRGQIHDAIADGLEEGMTHEDIREIQEILSADRTIYPEGLVTGYFGPLTRAALKRFQNKFELEVTGELDDETRAALETLLEERFGDDNVPPGLLSAPGIRAKFERRLELGCDNSGPGDAPFCARIKAKYGWDDDDDDDSDEDDDSDDDSNSGRDDDDDSDDSDDDSNDDDSDDDNDDDSDNDNDDDSDDDDGR